MEWLQRANKPDGHFIAGFLPDLRVPMEGDSYVRQAGAALALAQAARFYGDDRSAVIAKQALLTLLLETSVDAKSPAIRNVPIHQGNPLLRPRSWPPSMNCPIPPPISWTRRIELANLLQVQVQPDGSLNVSEVGDADGGAMSESRRAQAVEHWPGHRSLWHHSQPAKPARGVETAGDPQGPRALPRLLAATQEHGNARLAQRRLYRSLFADEGAKLCRGGLRNE